MSNYKKENINNYVVYKITDEFVIGQIGDILEDYTRELKSGNVRFIFDFSKVKMIDSSGLGTILMGTSQIMEGGEKIKICFDSSNNMIKELFSIIKLDSIIEYYGSLEDALSGQNSLSI